MDALFTHLFGSTPDQPETKIMTEEEITTRRALETCMGRLHMHTDIRNWFAQQLYDARRKEDSTDQPAPDRVHIQCALDELSGVDTSIMKVELLRRIAEARMHLFRSLQGPAIHELKTPAENETARAPEPEATKPSINWDHVASQYRYLARDRDDRAFLYTKRPHVTHNVWGGDGDYMTVTALASYDPGTCPWEDSLIERPTVTEAPRRGFAAPLHRRDMEI